MGEPDQSDGTEAYAGFGGEVHRTFAGSESWWPEPTFPPEGAPNVIVMLCDDLGYSDLGCYGSEIDTPNLDRLAGAGLRYTDFHVTPMCSPTRASLLTGVNSHLVGVGHVAHSDSGFPGYAMEIADNCATAGEIFGDNGYSTLMVGKWHLAKDSHCSEAGPRHSWPCQKGFDRFYGILDGFTNFHQPHRLVEDNHAVEVDEYPDDYYFTDDLTDRAIDMIRASRTANPEKPFFMYFSHGAVHAPLQAKQPDIDKYGDRYREGWDRLREERLSRMEEMGVVAPGTELAPRNHEDEHAVPAWDDLEPDQQELYARYMAVYAGMVDNIDRNFGRLRGALEEMGVWDNTIVLFTSDNGASREGEGEGTSSYYGHLMHDSTWRTDYERLDLIGGPQTVPHYPMGWAMACNTPFRLYKINTHAGGHQVPMIMSWPARLADGASRVAGDFRRQYAHVTDVLPTLLDVIGIEHPSERNGLALREMAGTSFAPTLADPAAPSLHGGQYYECWGHRGYRRGDWKIATLHIPMVSEFGDHEWELFDLSTDPTETMNLAGEHPEIVAELSAAWEEAAWANQVYPLEEGTRLKHIYRPPWDDVLRDAVTIPAGSPSMERYRSLMLVMTKSVAIEVSLDSAPGDEGYLFAHGDQGGGYGLYVLDGQLVWVFNDGRTVTELAAGSLDAGQRSVLVDVKAPGGNVWDIAISVDGEERASSDAFSGFVGMVPFEGIDVGMDRRSPVSWEIYERFGSFAYTGKLGHVRYAPGDWAPDGLPNMIPMLEEIGRKFE